MNFDPHRHWANTKCIYDFASDVTKDANGNTIEKDVDGVVTEYTYDDQNRLLSVKPAEASGGGGQATVEFTYDADGARVSKTVDGTTTEYLLDKNQRYHQVLEERTDSGSLIAEYVYGNQRISMKRGGEERFYHYDGHGSTSELTDGAGLVTDEYSYEAFGNLIASSGIGVNPFLYTGEAWDSETGMEYLRARYYAPGTGRFLNMDTHPGNNQVPLTLNKYLYGNGNPVMFADPSGNFGIVSVSISISIGGILGAVALPSYGNIFSRNSVCKNITIKRNYGVLILGDLLSLHWWTEFGDKSYGWWPNPEYFGSLSLRTPSYLIGGIKGAVNGYDPVAGTCILGMNCGPDRDPLHGQRADVSFHPEISAKGRQARITCSDAEKLAKAHVSEIANSVYLYSLLGTDGANCRIFQEKLMKAAYLEEGLMLKYLP